MTYRSIVALLAVASGAAAACGGTDVQTTASSSSSAHTSSSSTGAGGNGGATGSTTASTATSGGGSGTGGGAITAQQACADVVKARCVRIDACSNKEGVDIDYGDEATCEMRGLATCLDSLTANGTSATPAHDDACATSIPAESCADFYDNVSTTACTPGAGTLANGAACGAAGQCQSTYCTLTKDTVCGVCAALPVAGVTCTVNGDCGRDLVCVKNGNPSGTCAAPVADNGPCQRVDECEAGSTCVGGDVTTNMTGTCQPQATMVGAACDAKHKTKADCDRHVGVYCAAFDNVCHAVTLVPAGMPCGLTGTGSSTAFGECTGGALCVGAMGTTAGNCVAPAADGAACDDNAGPPCLQPAKCVAGVCTVPKPSACQ